MSNLTGGCQCGAVRYELKAEPTGASICHCRMCQKAFGAPIGAFTGVKLDEIEFTRGRPTIYKSSEAAERGFCNQCGTPLTYHFHGYDRISVSLGSLDEPERAPPEKAWGLESKLSWFDAMHTLPGQRTEDYATPEQLARMKPRATPSG